MNHQEVPLGQEASEVAEADLGHHPHHPPSQRRRHDNGTAEGGARHTRPRQHNSHGGENNQHHHPQPTRYRRYDASEGGANRPRGPRRSPEDTDAVNEQQMQQPIPRPAVTRYRRQGDSEARLRAQQQRQRQRQQREAERVERSDPPLQHHAPPPVQPRVEQEEAEEDERDGNALNRSASTESGFHNHTDRAEGDAVMGLEPDPEDDTSYGVPLRPEAEEYTESAESEQHGGAADPHHQDQPQHPPQPPPLPRDPLLNTERPHSHNEEALNPTYPSYVYRTPAREEEAYQGPEAPDQPFVEYSLQDHVYEEIGDPAASQAEGQALKQRRAGFRLFERDSYRQQEAVGSRLHHYDERSDGESDSPEKEAEFAPYPRADSCDQEEDIDQIVAEVKESLSSQSLERAAREGLDEEDEEEWPESEHGGQPEQEEGCKTPRPTEEEEPRGEESAQVNPSDESNQRRNIRDKRDAISLAIKDIKEAIEEVKTRTVRSPYTPDEPKEPIWVMRQDLSPTVEGDLQQSLGGESPGSGSTSPQGAESASQQLRMHESTDNFESPPPANKESRRSLASFPTYVEVPGPCDPEDLIDGIIFAANYLGSTQLLSDKTPSKNVRMMQAQEAVSRIKTAQKMAKNRKKAPEGEAQPMTEVDLFISTQRIKVLNADSQETMMDHPLRTISYIADIGNIVVLMARRRMPRSDSQENLEASDPAQDEKRQYKMICHVFESEDAQLIAQSIGQAFSVAYQEFLRANGINPEDLSQKEYSDLMNTQDMYNDDLIHFSKSENCKDVSELHWVTWKFLPII
ncbi:amyloid-beta A4 precursor protein-binding family A member 1 isoform X3 [Denticeps clupeoides]|uniref:amyloid-beta A4 precursor protein-binding family A member 1 isoform X3 n=1 Tax=Denticeps clupeoides TaxID=299321 RepID=UPI0010A33565|nr:amyloid-beta A4 precursor protein-binding family A member 1 isoform X3 [Denticeps clupeoides]